MKYFAYAISRALLAPALVVLALVAPAANAQQLTPSVEFSVEGTHHVSSGATPTPVGFQQPNVNEGFGWNSVTNSFTPPTRGVYYFSLSFVRDSYLPPLGTSDDVSMNLVVTNVLSGSSVVVGSAWAGESDATDTCARRMTGAYSVALRLTQFDQVTVTASSDGGAQRHIAKFELSGFLVRFGPVFSAAGTGQPAYLSPDLITFPTTHVNRGGGWNGTSTTPGNAFTATISGYYFFSLSFVRDSLTLGCSSDDVYMNLNVHKQSTGTSVVGYAWAGESDMQYSGANRMTGAYSVALYLDRGDSVWATSSGDGVTGYMAKYEMTGLWLGGFATQGASAFSVGGTDHTIFGQQPIQMMFQSILGNFGSNWKVFDNDYEVPFDGDYFFILSFVRDSYYNGGTWDDVNMNLTVDGIQKGYGWAGESDSLDPDAKRMTGAYSCVVHLTHGQIVRAESTSDSGLTRYIAKYELTGFLLHKD